MHIDFVHQDWVCDALSEHPLPMTPLFPGDELNCRCSDEVYVMNWTWRSDPQSEFEPLPVEKSVIIDAHEHSWICPENHEHSLTTPILRSRDDLICSECATQYQFCPTVKLPEELLDELRRRADMLDSTESDKS